MSKNTQNRYYEIGVFSPQVKKLLAEYVTNLHILKSDARIHDKLMDLLYEEHGKNIVVLWNLKKGSLPDDNRSIIKVRLSEEPKLEYKH